jgi:hypothetical protein
VRVPALALQWRSLSRYAPGIGLLLALVYPGWAQSLPPIHHDLRVVVSPEQHTLDVEDTITLPSASANPAQNTWSFFLHGGTTAGTFSGAGGIDSCRPVYCNSPPLR